MASTSSLDSRQRPRCQPGPVRRRAGPDPVTSRLTGRNDPPRRSAGRPRTREPPALRTRWRHGQAGRSPLHLDGVEGVRAAEELPHALEVDGDKGPKCRVCRRTGVVVAPGPNRSGPGVVSAAGMVQSDRDELGKSDLSRPAIRVLISASGVSSTGRRPRETKKGAPPSGRPFTVCRFGNRLRAGRYFRACRALLA